VIGNLVSLFTLMKGQPLAYNKDNQEDKEPVFDTVDTLRGSLRALGDMMPHLSIKRKRMHAAAQEGFATATDLADYLVRKGVAFRDAHEIVGRAVRCALDLGKDLSELPLEDLRSFSTVIEDDVFDVLTLEGSVAARDHLGGTAPEQVRAQVKAARMRIAGQS
jgi:argininosuccinate lyase